MLMLKDEDYAEKAVGYGTYASVKLLTDLGLEMLHTLLILVLIITHTGTQIIPLTYHNLTELVLFSEQCYGI